LLATLISLAATAQTSPSAPVPAESLPLTLSAPPTATPKATNSTAEDLLLIPEDAKLFKESMLWQHTVSLRTGAGYDDNVLLSPGAPQGSAFATAGLDGSFSRLPLDGWGVDLVVSGDDVRYLQDVPTGGTDFWLADLTLKRFLGDNWVAGVETSENYLDEVDYVDALTGPEFLDIQGDILNIKPFVRRNLGTNWWSELDFPAAREVLAAPLDNVWKYGPQLQLGFSDDRQQALTLSYQVQWFDHDDWPALSADGLAIGTRTLSLIEQRIDLDWRQYWDDASHWSTDTKLAYVRDEDNGGDFFNFDEYSASERLRYRSKNWEWAATVRGGYLDYPVQRTGIISGPTLDEVLLHATIHGERRLTGWLKVYAEYNYARVLSNLSDIRYAANTVTLGLIWEF
jgi:hypothetical protein